MGKNEMTELSLKSLITKLVGIVPSVNIMFNVIVVPREVCTPIL